MINIQCSKLEDIRKNPSAFVQQLTEAETAGGSRKGMFGLWQDAVRSVHDGQMTFPDAKNFLNQGFMVFAVNKANLKKQEFLMDRLQPYFDEFNQRGYTFLESRKHIKWQLTPTATLTGNTPFSVFIDQKLTVYFFVERPLDWKDQLRFPLLQDYLLRKTAKKGIEQVEIGIYCLETNAFELQQYSAEEIAVAVSEAISIFNNISDEFNRRSGNVNTEPITLFG